MYNFYVNVSLKNKIDSLYFLLESICNYYKTVKCLVSLSIEDILLVHAILSNNFNIDLYLLNTNYLNKETVYIVKYVYIKYGYKINQIFPRFILVKEYGLKNSLKAFYGNSFLRKLCCIIRKIEPLGRTLFNADAWITGQRKEHSLIRNNLLINEYDKVNMLQKFNPLVNWTIYDIWSYIRLYNLPVNSLYSLGYSSIGCKTCTKSIRFGEDNRYGRWWWEYNSKKECGLHSI